MKYTEETILEKVIDLLAKGDVELIRGCECLNSSKLPRKDGDIYRISYNRDEDTFIIDFKDDEYSTHIYNSIEIDVYKNRKLHYLFEDTYEKMLKTRIAIQDRVCENAYNFLNKNKFKISNFTLSLIQKDDIYKYSGLSKYDILEIKYDMLGRELIFIYSLEGNRNDRIIIPVRECKDVYLLFKTKYIELIEYIMPNDVI